MFDTTSRPGMGWVPDYPDFRDYDINKDEIPPPQRLKGQKQTVKDMLGDLGLTKKTGITLEPTNDLRQWCTPIENQLSLGSCTAHAGVGMVEYFARRAYGEYIDASRLFLYKVTRNLLNWTGDTGAYLRTTMAALTLFGVPPEEYWPYIITEYEKEPSPFLYAYAQNYQAISYYRLDPAGTSREVLLQRIKTYLQGKLPSMFGFTVYSSFSQAQQTGQIPYPTAGDKRVGGHAVLAVGYDDGMKIKNANSGVEMTGALLIRNSWGAGWGEKGYGWLPYEYVKRSLAVDWWSILKSEWIGTKQFGI
jgi:C1A family cysteine protease